MMGHHTRSEWLFYYFGLEDQVPEDLLLRLIDTHFRCWRAEESDQAFRRHSQWVTRIGGALLIIIGIALMTGAWGDFANWLRATVGTGTVGV